ncbi:hypothetical protein GOP47_0026651 [Adiantum capillus-veneris]|nr:hypothetical protein GOP47_0026651 [Adiantum capillus-veneris]
MVYFRCRLLVSIALLLTFHTVRTSPASSSSFHRLFLLHGNNQRMLRPNLNPEDLLELDMHALHLDTEGAGAGAEAEAEVERVDSSSLPAHDTPHRTRYPKFANRSEESLLSSSSSCDATYGVMPCTDTFIGNLFLFAVYGFLLFLSAKMLSDGSELLLTVLDPGLIGGLLLPILGALPDSILIMVSGLGGSTSEAQQQVLVGIGLLAGSIVMLLTLLWGTCLIIGRCDLKVDESTGRLKAVDKQLSKRFGLTDMGIEVDDLTQLSARIMILSVIPFIVAQLPRIFGFSTNGNIPVLVACILSLSGLLAYCLYQVFTPWLLQRRKEFAQRRVMKFLALEKLAKHGGDQKLVDEQGNLDRKYAKSLFTQIDRNHDGIVNMDELRAMLSVSMVDGERTEALINNLMEEFDENENKQISVEEFLKGMQKWCVELKIKQKPIEEYREHAEKSMEDLQGLEDEDDENGGQEAPPSRKQIIRKAVLLLVGGTVIAGVFADPLVDAVDAFSTSISIPSFFVSFVLLPLASNSSEGVSCIMFSARKKRKNFSLTYSQIYGAVTMNSTMGLGIFLAVVYARQLEWDFSSEVLIIVLVVVIMGLVGSFRKVFPLWMAGIALLLYPLSLGLVAVLDYVAGWQ